MRKLMLIVSIVSLVGCTIKPEVASEQEVTEIVEKQKQWILTTRLNITKPLTLSDVIVLALKNNLELEQARYRVLVNQTTLDNTLYSYLPKSNSAFNRSVRNNDGGASDVLPPARDRNTVTSSISWSSLDLGQAYLQAKQSGNDLLIKQLQQKKVISRIVREVISDYLALAMIEHEIIKARTIEQSLIISLAKARALDSRELIDPINLLSYQEQMLSLQIQLQELESEYLKTKQMLLTRISAPGLELQLSHKGRNTLSLSLDNITLEALEQFALYNRSDLRESDYKIRNAGLEIRKTWLNALPNFSIGYTNNYDSDPNLRNNEWLQVDLNVAMKVIELIALPAQINELKKKEQLEKLSSLAFAVTVLGQVREANISFLSDKSRLGLERKREQLQHEIVTLKQQRVAYDLMDELDSFKSEVNAVIASVRRGQAYSNYQSSILKLLEQAGVDLFPSHATLASGEELQQSVDVWLKSLPSTIESLLHHKVQYTALSAELS
ncbi:TolC family protein [Photobacterium makurazakiensis]|uniref:TolC family protein n=1 Tax=Photobacterium makurazakiensis TaxID=2910234 RepID=UPI003D0D8D6A